VVFTGSNDDTLRVWDAKTGQQMHSVNLGAELKAVTQVRNRLFVLTEKAFFVLSHEGYLDETSASARASAEVTRWQAQIGLLPPSLQLDDLP
jgi:hypothetical protein